MQQENPKTRRDELFRAGEYDGPRAYLEYEGDTVLCVECAENGNVAIYDEDADEPSGYTLIPSFGDMESDCPQHCDECGTLLSDTLTEDGVTYVLDAIIENRERGDGDEVIVNLWREHFADYLRDRLEECPHCGEDGLYKLAEPVENNGFTYTHRCLDCLQYGVPEGEETPLMRAIEYAFDHEDDEAGCAIQDLIKQVIDLSKPTRLVIVNDKDADYDEFEIWSEDGRAVKAVILDLSDTEEEEGFPEYTLPNGNTVACWASSPVESDEDARFVNEVWFIRDDDERRWESFDGTEDERRQIKKEV